ncbi:MAG: HU family DNA-binding protein [Gammaproteobacteria bacterium]
MAVRKKAVATNVKKAPTKSEIITQLAEKTDLTKKDIGAVFDELNVIIKKSLKSANEFSMPGLMKVRVVKKPATKARLGKNPFTGEEITIKAKPARKTVKVTPLKGLKDMV